MNPTDAGNTTEARWARLQEIFSRALDLPEAERASFVENECGADSQLRDEIKDLLAADSVDAANNLLTNALGAAIDATSRDRRKALVGRVLGNYRLVSVLGHGGTGTVYLAERADRQYSAQVAIKIVDSGSLHVDLGLRFRAERQILASLNHANIARLLDAGETPEGQPFLVMEYVHGEPLDRFCDQRQLDLHARLRLFLEICNAVQYAHQNLVVHRDLKPANILVTVEGAPKLLDFGIAKLLDSGEAAAVLALTRMNDRLLTPEYASPEQILGRPVTTASDVYALGVVLYELLTGLRPYTVPASASQLELERSICVTDPVRPSAAVRRFMGSPALGEHADIGVLAAARGVTPEKLARRLSGDIDAIVMRALRKEPERRYASVEQFAADLRRYLAREPVGARQGNWIYYSQRFARRHAFGVSAGAAFFVFVIAFGVAMSIQTQRIAAERDRATQENAIAERVSEFMLSIFGASDPFESHGKVVTARQLLDQAGRNIRGDVSQPPEVRARLLEAIGRAYNRQNEYALAVSFLEQGLHIRNQMEEPDGAQIASMMSELSNAQRLLGDLPAAEKTLRAALDLTKQHRNERSLTYAMLLSNLGRGELQVGNISAAHRYLEESLALNKALRDPRDPEIAVLLLLLSSVYLWSDDLPAAERASRAAVDIFREQVAEMHPDRVQAELRLAEVLLAQDRADEADPLFQKSLEAHRTLYGSNSRQEADVLDSLASVRRAQGSLAEAEGYSRRALASMRAALGDEHFMTGYFSAALGSHLLRSRKFEEAERLVQQSLKIYEKTLPADHQYVAASEHVLGEIYLESGRYSAAEATLTAAMNRWKRTKSAEWRAARSQSALGEVLFRTGRAQEAERNLRDSYAVLAADMSAERDARIKAQQRMERFYTVRGEKNKLKDLMLDAALASDKPVR
jgi:eukaryotic-like serine/threonine-protein kinase